MDSELFLQVIECLVKISKSSGVCNMIAIFSGSDNWIFAHGLCIGVLSLLVLWRQLGYLFVICVWNDNIFFHWPLCSLLFHLSDIEALFLVLSGLLLLFGFLFSSSFVG